MLMDLSNMDKETAYWKKIIENYVASYRTSDKH